MQGNTKQLKWHRNIKQQNISSFPVYMLVCAKLDVAFKLLITSPAYLSPHNPNFLTFLSKSSED
jgi:hypothetical protein